ncbi:fungal-specific transcription factor domain-containing protein [Thelonectria olida]|uniref:Fungal-specific transcription factor domain-containing protein n=1 Tax=Thelonectria olida TaxID=1576542 RepID=A0A9P8VWD7_9HYPO|nr:fungal-specific transcription factor domain-containing protein [Thelonectria olida]
MAPPHPPQTGSGDEPPQREFAFVAYGHSRGGSRSHAMREHWKRRRHTMNHEKKRREHRPHKMLLPTPSTSSATDVEASSSTTSIECGDSSSNNDAPDETGPINPNEISSMMDSIPGQALSGMNLALGSSRLDPFDKFPIKLTSQHHKLLHHWLSTYATMMFEDAYGPGFNPMRDVWFPLDLSNAASFNAIMAHSAAHLARMQGFTQSKEALRFKTEAVRIVQLWMNDPELALGDDVLAAVLRLLTYERYWGTEAEWRVHHNGLLNLIRARGGIEALKSNWRLELTTFLVSLMSKPSWFDCSNQIGELSSQPLEAHVHPVLGDVGNLHRIRCLWLLSFVQDMGTFRTNSPEISSHGMTQYTALHEILVLLKTHLRHDEVTSKRLDLCSHAEFRRLACLFFICILVQQATSVSTPTADAVPTGGPRSYDMEVVELFDFYLDSNRPMWQGSVEDLYNTLFHHFDAPGGSGPKPDYVQHMANVMASMSGGVRYGVERCLLNILCQTERNGYNAFDEEWTPDSLLSLIPAQ